MADGKVVISTALNNKGLEKGISNISGSLGGLKSVVGKLERTIAAAFSIKAIVQFGVESSKAAMQLSGALTGLKSILDGQGRSFSKAKTFLEDYIKDGLIPMSNAAAAYKNLAMRGYDDSQIQSTLVALKNASAFGRQASLSMGEAVQSATEGLKNENSILVDNAGITKNVAKMWDEYARSIGTTANNLTQQQKIQAEVTGILEESKYQIGDAAKVAGTLSGQLQQLSFNFNNLKIAVGNIVNPIVQHFLPTINAAVTAVTRLANAVATTMGSIFGKAVVQTEATAEVATKAADAENTLAEGVKNASKAAKKSTAIFDELNVLQSGPGSGGSGGAAGDSETKTSTGLIAVTGEVKDELSPQFKAIIEGVKKYIEPLTKIDFGPAKESLTGLGKSFKELSDVLSGVFSWVWFNILVPFAKWDIEEATPARIDALSAAIKGVSSTVETLSAGFQKLWPSLEPIVSWIQDTILVVFEDLEEIGNRVAETWEKNAPKIEETFENLGVVIEKVWAVIGPVFTWIRDGLSKIAVDTPITDLQYIIDTLYGLSEILAGILTLDIGKVFNGFGELAGAELDRATSYMKTYAEALGIDTEAIDQKVREVGESIGNYFSDAWAGIQEIWGNVAQWFQDKVITPVQDFFAPIENWFSDLFGSVWQTISDVFYDIGVIAGGCWETIKIVWGIVSSWFDENIIQPVKGFFTDLWESVSSTASNAWEKIKGVVEPFFTWIDENVIQPVEEAFFSLWGSVESTAEDAGQAVEDAFSAVVDFFKGLLNGIIKALNKALSWVFSGINGILEDLKNFSIAGAKPFGSIRTISVPQIPYLAQGAVLPANRPFLAVVGDQKNGTNIEAPLETIKQALGEVLAAQGGGNGDINIRFTGELAQLARVLKPVIDRENRRVGGELIRSTNNG